MNLTIIIPGLLIALVAADLVRGILSEGRKRMQSRQRRDSVLRWVRDAQTSH